MNSLYTAKGYHICSWFSADGYHNNQKCDRHTHTQTNEQNLATIILDEQFTFSIFYRSNCPKLSPIILLVETWNLTEFKQTWKAKYKIFF